MLGAASVFTAATASAAAPPYATGTPDITHTATNAEIGEALDVAGNVVTMCGLLGPVAVACQLSYDAHGPGEMERIYYQGCDLESRTWINPNSIGSFDRSYTSYAAVNC
ncbi:hypothetical protein DT076_00980 [Desertihabitans brevis]|uniref:Uncharacterized protein n=1 Tax=Desertihabitans brevis TaxID=2268447 RepID=A0A367YZ02_9ACTN|nr:hypothetical protein DT076_00980 [Desertihabitans brevis]